MKLLLMSDPHLDHVTEGVSRFADISALMDQTMEIAIEENIDAYCCLGDLADPDKNLTVFRAVAHAMKVAMELADEGIESHWLVGNHDVIEDGSGSSVLQPFRAITREGAPIFMHDAPHRMPIGKAGSSLQLLALPFTPLSHTYDPLPLCTAELKTDYPLVVLSHLGIHGIQPGEETKDIPRGRDVILPHRVLAQRKAPTYVFSGHYHLGQQYENVTVVGSLARLMHNDYGGVKPSFLIVDLPDA